MNNILIRAYETPLELLRAVETLPEGMAGKKKYKNAISVFGRTDEGTGFNGKFSDVKDEMINQKFGDSASCLNDELRNVISIINTTDFLIDKWAYERKLDSGDAINMDRLLNEGEVYWCGVRKRRTEKKVVRLFCGIGGKFLRTKEELAMNGAAAVGIAERLESDGVPVEIWAAVVGRGTFGGNGINDISIAVKIKDAYEFCDLGMIGYITGNNHFFRNIMFRAIAKEAIAVKNDTRSSLGRSGRLTKEALGLEGEAGVVLLQHAYNKEEAEASVREAFYNLGNQCNQ